MNEKQLPLYDSPIKGLQFFTLDIIFDDERIKPWFYCNYIQLEWLDDWCIIFSLLQEYYVGIPFIDKQILIRDTISNISVDPIEFLISNINLGWYTQLNLDEYFIPHKIAYKSQHFIHDSLICGYNIAEQKFSLFGYDKNFKLAITYASFEEVRNAYASVGNIIYPEKSGSMAYYNLIFLIRKNKEEEYSMDISCMKELLNDYLQGNNYSLKTKMIHNPPNNKTYGINIYDKLSNCFAEADEKVIEDIRLLRTIYEHKKVMVMRVKYLIDNGYMIRNEYLLSEFIKLEDMSLVLKNLHIKYLLNKDTNILRKIANLLHEMKYKEIDAISSLLRLL